jgi:hypothetical protein
MGRVFLTKPGGRSTEPEIVWLCRIEGTRYGPGRTEEVDVRRGVIFGLWEAVVAEVDDADVLLLTRPVEDLLAVLGGETSGASIGDVLASVSSSSISSPGIEAGTP